MNHELSNFAVRLRRAIGSGFDASQFGSLAVELFSWQYQHNAAYRKFCDQQEVTPGGLAGWRDIPFISTTAFKWMELTCLSANERTAVFHSSGTTGQEPGRHFHGPESLPIYEASLWAWFKANWGGVEPLLVLTPGPQAAPHSSLVHMFETIRRHSGCPETVFAGVIPNAGVWELDFSVVLDRLQSAVRTGTPLALFGTAFSFVHLLDHLELLNLRFELPSGSRALETGGYKNRSRELPKAELHALMGRRLGIASDQILCEYGMSELSSQAYARAGKSGLDGVPLQPSDVVSAFHFPPWARAQVVSPETGEEVGEGETGLIRILDLANVFSVAAIQTEDLGIRRGDGFELAGRAGQAEPRGCSLMSA